MKKIVSVFIAIAFLSVSTLYAQSLVELAKKTREQRRGKKVTKKYTNFDLKHAKGNVSMSTTPPQPQAEKSKKAKNQEEINQEYEKRLIGQYRLIEDLKRNVEIANLNFNKLRNRFYSESSGPMRDNVIRFELKKAFLKIGEFKRKLKEARDKLEKLKEEARKEGVPPGIIQKAKNIGQSEVVIEQNK